MKSKTLSITINSSPKKVYEFVADLKNLPKWATTFCKSIKKIKNEWVAQTPQGPVKIRIAPKNDFGILDHCVSPSGEVEVFVPMRVVANGKGSKVIFTLFQQLGMADENFAKDIKLVEEDLDSLKNVIEK